MSVNAHRPARRVRVERGIYQQPNGKYAVCFMVDGKPRFRTVGHDLEAPRAERSSLVDAARRGEVPVAPNLASGRWLINGSRATQRSWQPINGVSARWRRIATTSTGICPHGWRGDGCLRLPSMTSQTCSARCAPRAARPRRWPTRWRACIACCALRCARAGSSSIRSLGSSVASARGPNRACSGYSGATRSLGCLRAVRTGIGRWSRPPCSPGCGSRSCSGWSGTTPISVRARSTCGRSSRGRIVGCGQRVWRPRRAPRSGRSRSCRSSERCSASIAPTLTTASLAIGCSRRRSARRLGIATRSDARSQGGKTCRAGGRPLAGAALP